MTTKKHHRKHLYLLLCALVCAAAMAVPGRAQSLVLAPAQVVEKFKPGVPFQFDLSTVNTGDTPVDMHVEITDFWYDEKNEKVFSAPGTSPRSAANWIQFVPDHFEVGPHGTQKMKAIVTPPADARGGYYAVLFVQSKPQLSFPKSDGKGVFTSMRIGCLVLLRSMHVEWAGKLPAGNYTAVISVAYGEDRIETQQVAFNVAAP
jgi:hypothetical protein